VNRIVFTVLLVSAAAQAQPTSEPESTDIDPFVSKQQLFSQAGSAFTEGTQVWLQDVVVQQISGNVLRIRDHHHQLFVAPVDPSTLDFLRAGAHVDVRGTLRRTQGVDQARLTYAMSHAAARRFAHDRFYVAGAIVEPAS
jgi:hypothetical protein